MDEVIRKHSLQLASEQPIEVEEASIKGANASDTFLRDQLDPILESKSIEQLCAAIDTTADNLKYLYKDIECTVTADDSSETPRNSPLIPVKAFLKVEPKNRYSHQLFTSVVRSDPSLNYSFKILNSIGIGEFILGNFSVAPSPHSLKSGSLKLCLPFTANASGRAVVEAFSTSQKVVNAAFDNEHSGLSVSVGKFTSKANPAAPRERGAGTDVSAGISLSNSAVTNVSASASDDVRASAGDRLLMTTFASFYTKHFAQFANGNPSTAFDLDFNTRYSTLVGQNEEANDGFSKSTLKLSLSQFLDRHRCLALKGTFATGLLYGDSAGVQDKFFDVVQQSGQYALDGYALNGIGPKSDSISTGANGFSFLSVLLSSRIPFVPPGLRLNAQVNSATLANVKGDDIGNSFKSIFQAARSSSASIGVAYHTPGAYFALNYAKPLQFQETDLIRTGFQMEVGIKVL